MLVFVCSPFKGIVTPTMTENEIKLQYRRNLIKTARYCRIVANEGNIPLAPHLFFKDFLSDEVESERVYGMKAGRDLLKICDEVHVFGSIISAGMEFEIELASNLGIPIKYRKGEI